MSVASDLKNALSGIGLPCVQTLYTGNEDTYLTFNLSSIPAAFSDNHPAFERYMIQVHLYAPLKSNITTLAQNIKQSLSDAGYTWPSMVDASDKRNDSDGATRHLVFETETEVSTDG